jgi:hypothetical protein
VESDVVHTGKEQVIDELLEVGESDVEVFLQPGSGFRADALSADDVGGRRSELRDEDAAVAVEHFRFRDIGDGVEVEEIAG